jgi:hypothetical protein
MVKRNTVIAVGLSAIIGFLVVYHVFYNEEARVKRRFKELSEQISKEAGETKLIAAATVNKITRMIQKTIQIDIPSRSISKTFARKELAAPIFHVRSQYLKMTLRFVDFVIDLSEEGTADVHVTGNLTGKLLSGESVDETHELHCLLKKNEKDEWIFSGIEIVEVLEK